MAFNKTATAFFESTQVTHVLLLWDGELNICGVQAVNKDDTRSFKLTFGNKGNGAGFSATPFLNYLGYNMHETRSFPMQWKERAKMFVFEISPDRRNSKPS